MLTQSAADFVRLARFSFSQGEYGRCIAWARQCEQAARREKHLEYELWAISEQCIAWANLGEPQRALEVAFRLMNRARQTRQESWLLLGTRLFVSRLAGMDLRNRWDEIHSLLLEGLARARQLKHTREEIDHLRLLGEYAITMGEWDLSHTSLQEALRLLSSSRESNHFFYFVVYGSLSKLMEKQRAYEEAVQYARLSLRAAEQDGNPNFVADARLQLATAEQARGELGTALSIAQAVLSLAIDRGWLLEERDANALLGQLQLTLGHPAEALPHAERALALSISQESKEKEVQGYLVLGQVRRDLGQQHEAYTALQRARCLAEEHHYEALLRQANALLDAL